MPDAMPIKAEEVFEILVRENTGMLLTYLRSVAWNPSAVDDLFQETMLVAWRRLSDYDQTRPFGAWLRGIAARLVLAHARKSKRDLMVCDERVLEYLDRQVERISQRDGDCWDESWQRYGSALRRFLKRIDRQFLCDTWRARPPSGSLGCWS